MRLLRHRLFSAVIAALAFTGAATLAGAQQAQPDADRFPAAAMSFLGTELPAMEAAVADKNRDYFEDAMRRMLDFSERWGFRSRDNPALARFPMCTDAVTDFLVVGLCRFNLSTDACQPSLATTFNTNLQRCREIAARN